eukprot:COSAG02_NODE_4245_length_5590_cov_3.965580_2_plen_87_part_00
MVATVPASHAVACSATPAELPHAHLTRTHTHTYTHVHRTRTGSAGSARATDTLLQLVRTAPLKLHSGIGRDGVVNPSAVVGVAAPP